MARVTTHEALRRRHREPAERPVRNETSTCRAQKRSCGPNPATPAPGEMIHDQIGEDPPAGTQDAVIARYRENLG